MIEQAIREMAYHAKKLGATAVTKVRLMVGSMTGFEEESFATTFSVLATDTLLDGAELEVSFYPGSRIEVLSFDID